MSTVKEVLKVKTDNLILTWESDERKSGFFELDGEIILDFERMEVGDSLQNKMHPEWKVTGDRPHFIVHSYLDSDITLEVGNEIESLEDMIEDSLGEIAYIIFSEGVEYTN